MIKSQYGYDLVQEFEKSKIDLYSLEHTKEIKNLYTTKLDNEGLTMLSPTSTSFINTSEATAVARYFEKHGVYTKADPVYDKYEYQRFWDEEERKRREGVIIPGELYKDTDGQFKIRNIHITGEHYGYLNYARIKRVPEEVLDDELSEIFGDSKLQTVAATKEVSFPDFWDGDYYYFHAVELARKLGKHLIVGKARRKGYSYKNGWICANRADLYPNTTTGITAYDSGSLYPDGTFSMADEYLQWLFETTDWSKRRLRDSKEGFIKFGYKLKGSPSVERGFLSSIMADPFGPAQPGAMRGKDADLIIVEEAGKARNLHDFLESTLPTLKAGKYLTGLMIIFGTGGGDENYWEAFEELFYDPDTSDFLLFENIFDKDAEGESCGFFMPDFVNKEGFYDKHGNSIVTEAFNYEVSIRNKLKAKSKIKKLKDRSMEYCFTPAEAFNRGSENIFPTELIQEQISRIQKNPLLKNIGREGVLKYSDRGEVIFKDAKFLSEEELKFHHPAVNELKLKPNKDNYGCFVQFQSPFTIEGRVPDNLYRIFHDPFGVDKENKDVTSKHSFGCLYVYERVNNITKTKGGRLVGVYIGRPETTDEYNEILYRISQYYNATIAFEKNVGNVYNYFRQLEELDRLAPEPKSIFDSEDVGVSTKVKYGIHINDQRKRNGAVYLKDWLLEKVDKDENGNWKRNIHYIYDINLLKELLKWNLKGNFDRVSTMIVGMYDIKEQYFVEVEKPIPETNGDSFFDRELF